MRVPPRRVYRLRRLREFRDDDGLQLIGDEPERSLLGQVAQLAAVGERKTGLVEWLSDAAAVLHTIAATTSPSASSLWIGLHVVARLLRARRDEELARTLEPSSGLESLQFGFDLGPGFLAFGFGKTRQHL